ncbi:MAG: hypothetical protein ACLUA5_13085 [Enterococcus faecium]
MKVLPSFFKEDWHYFKYNLSKTLNGIFYFLCRIPGVKKVINERIYAAYELKSLLSILLTILSILYSFLIKIFVFVIVILTQVSLITFFKGDKFSDVFSKIDQPMMQQGAFLWLLLVVVIWGFYNHFSVITTQKLIDFYTAFSLSRNQFILGQKFVGIIKNAIFYFFAGLFYGYVANNMTLVLFIPLSYLAGNFLLFNFCQRIYMLNYSTVRRRWLGTIATGFFLVIIGSLYYLDLVAPLTRIFTNWMLLPVWVILILVGYKSAWNYPKQNEFIRKTIVQSLSFYEAIKSTKQENDQYIGQGLKMQKQLQVTKDNQIDRLEGNEYLNALLFSRYRQVFNKKIRALLVGFSIVVVGLTSLRIAGVSNYINEVDTLQLLPLLFLLMYFLSFGKQVVQMLFVNCDSSMLYYSFYRERSTILKGFTYRLRQIFKYNSLIILEIFLLFVLLQVLNNFYLSWQFFGTLLLLLLALGLLFSFHELFIYYLLQPFTVDMSVKSPLYKVITWVFYYFAYMNTQVRATGFLYVIFISIISILYVAIGLVVIYKMAPKTFKIKE